MTEAPTLSRYLTRAFLVSFGGLLVLLLGVASVFEVAELMRRAGSAPGVTFGSILAMAALKLPYTGSVVLPFVVLFSGIHTCWKLNRSQELVVIRAAGLSVWQFLSPLLAAAMLAGVLASSVGNPLSTALLSKYHRLESRWLGKDDSLVAVSKTGIWLRQPLDAGGYALLRAGTLDRAAWKVTDLMVYLMDPKDVFLRRIDAPEAFLREGRWEIQNALVSDAEGSREEPLVTLPTAMTGQTIENSFADPDTVSFWNIPAYIKVMEETGFPSTRLHIHFHALLAQPFLFAAMILLAATVSLRPPRFGGAVTLVALGVAGGFLVFFMQSFLAAFGISQKIPAALAAWTPAVVTLCLGLAALLHLEDG